MPEMNGFALAERLLHTHSGVKILYMSGYDKGRRVPSCPRHGGPYLQMPFDPDVLLCAVRDVLEATQPCYRDSACTCSGAPRSNAAEMAAPLARTS